MKDGVPVGGVGAGVDERLRNAIDRARQSDFYRKHLEGYAVGGANDLPSLPLTFRRHLQDASPYGFLIVPPEKAWHYHETSGTTGQPISSWCSLTEVRLLADMLCRMVPELSDRAILLNRFPLFAPGSFIFEQALQSVGACHIAAGNLSWDVPFTRALGFLTRLRATALACLPFEALLLRELAREQGMDLEREAEALRVIFCGGAVLPPSLKRIIERDWGARVVEIYGSNEAMGLGISCIQGRLHLCTDLAALEVLDSVTHRPVATGEVGVLTVTSLVHEVMPLVRYVTEDLIRVDTEPCPCGDPRPTATVLGRAEDVVEIEGQRATSYDLLDALHDVADRAGTRIFYAVVRERGLHVMFEAAADGPFSPAAAQGALWQRLKLPVTVEYLAHGDVMDRSALLRSPKIYKPSMVSDWRKQPRKTVTIMEAILEWPRFDAATVVAIVKRQFRSARRRRRLLRED